MERYHLTLTTNGQPVMHGWWADLATAERKFTSWIGEHGSVAGARVTLVDEAEARVLKSWPTEP
ncbi:hypothetical protein [Streptomyces sp. NPDC001530]|uniref:hypothetical protein n=1 Tax=Streptomyces sp. NPDC001530 TaxID=3364582 RepID=UPI0036999601